VLLAPSTPWSTTMSTMRGSFTMNKGSESDADPPERAIEGSHPLEDATSFRRVELRLLHTNGTQEQVR